MLDIIARSHVHPPPPVYQPLDDFRSSSFFQAGPFGVHPPPSRQPSLPRASSLSSVKQGLRTPPPDMMTGPLLSFGSEHRGQFEPQISSTGVEKILDSFRGNTQTSQPARRPSLYSSQPEPEIQRRRSTSTQNGASLTVPSTINSSKGSLAEFAAQITCLFWFESTFVLHRVAESSTLQPLSPLPPLAPDAVPTTGFRKWVGTILTTTQVSPNVILLALMFIYRLKKLNPTVKGKAGSEFRLFTVALMLGNKFLDDNTYTNKTWAEVSGINVQEIHIMEVEFLSNMRYSLYVSDNEWRDWHTKLGKFSHFWERASRSPLETPARPTPVNPSFTPSFPQLPSPPSSTNSSPPFANALSPSSSGFPHHLPAPPHAQHLKPPALPYTPLPQPDFDSVARKRSMDFDPTLQPPTKRVTRSSAPKISVSVPQFPMHIPFTAPPGNASLPRLQPPASYTAPSSQNSSTMPTLVHSHQPQLPLPGTRSMSTVYSHASQPPVSAPMSSTTHNINISPYNPRQSSPYLPSTHHSAASSPTTPVYPHSPTWILGNRDSPYRPVRSVNTLLVPPPTNAPQPQQLGYDQMHYQPLTKSRSEYKTGVVPYMHPEITWSSNWPEPHFYG